MTKYVCMWTSILILTAGILAVNGPAEERHIVDPAYALNKYVMPSIVEIKAETKQFYKDRAVPVVFVGKGLGLFQRLIGVQVSRSGIGVIVDRDGYVLTSAHVVSGLKYIRLVLSGGQEAIGKVMSIQPERDLAMIRFIPRGDCIPLPFAEPNSVKLNDVVFTVVPAPKKLFCRGTVTGLGKSIPWKDESGTISGLIETNLSLVKGDSGGPLLNADGKLIGMNIAGYLHSKELSYAVSLDSIVDFCYRYFESKKS